MAAVKFERKDDAQKLRRTVFEPDFEKVFQTFGLFLRGVKDRDNTELSCGVSERRRFL